MKSLLVKDKRRRLLYFFFEKRRAVLKALAHDISVPSDVRFVAYRQLLLLPRDSSITRIRGRCVLTNRSRAVYRRFGLSRLMFRKFAWQGKLVGVKKASW